jgi:hypothetical protein
MRNFGGPDRINKKRVAALKVGRFQSRRGLSREEIGCGLAHSAAVGESALCMDDASALTK